MKISDRIKSKVFPYLIVLLQNLPEAGEVESLIILQQNKRQVELAESQFDVVHRLPHDLFFHFRLEE